MRLILHIGTDKAGSTAIQQHLFVNRGWLQARSVYIPGTGFGATNGHAALFQRDDNGQWPQLLEELRRAAEAGYDSALLSWEGLSLYSADEIRQLHTMLLDCDAMVLVYLREQADFVQSGLLQQVKSLVNTLSLSAFEQRPFSWQWLRAWRTCHHPSRNYFRLLRRWQQGLPGAVIAPRIFASASLRNADVVEDFLEQLGLLPDAEFVRLARPSNSSLDVESGLLVEAWQARGVSPQALRCRVDIALALIADDGAGEKYFLSPGRVASIRRYYRRSNRQLAQQFLPAMEYPFPAPGPCCRESLPLQLVERVRVRGARIVELEKTPTFWGPLISGADPQLVASLSHGWHSAEDWGAWSNGKSSVIRFRVYRQNILPQHAGLRIYIKGRYYGDTVRSRVGINGRDFGQCSLNHEHPGLELSLAELGPCETVAITLQHSTPISPQQYEGAADARELAFGVEYIGYDFVDAASAPPPDAGG